MRTQEQRNAGTHRHTSMYTSTRKQARVHAKTHEWTFMRMQDEDREGPGTLYTVGVQGLRASGFTFVHVPMFYAYVYTSAQGRIHVWTHTAVDSHFKFCGPLQKKQRKKAKTLEALEHATRRVYHTSTPHRPRANPPDQIPTLLHHARPVTPCHLTDVCAHTCMRPLYQGMHTRKIWAHAQMHTTSTQRRAYTRACVQMLMTCMARACAHTQVGRKAWCTKTIPMHHI